MLLTLVRQLNIFLSAPGFGHIISAAVVNIPARRKHACEPECDVVCYMCQKSINSLISHSVMVAASFCQCKIVTAVSPFKLMILALSADIYELFIFAVCAGAFIFSHYRLLYQQTECAVF